MKFFAKDPPRRFQVGNAVKFEMADCGSVALSDDEQLTLLTGSGAEYDVARKAWGFYATPSLNGRLVQFGLRGVLIKNRGTLRYFVLLVEKGHEQAFKTYCEHENLAVVTWLDDEAALARLEQLMQNPGGSP